MFEAQVVQEIFVTAPNKVGLLAQVTKAISDAGVDISAIGAYEKDGRGEFMVVTSDNEKATAALANIINMSVERKDVVMLDLPAEPGSLAKAAAKLARADIDVHWIYGTAGDASRVSLVLRVDDPVGAVDVLNS
ncbi:MAG: ACT domain-containing protein [Coriobacteriia bacterium]|nr:ACT domain-containing protein [Coriobacteriia bacterium]